MDMPRLLISDADGIYASAIKTQLKNEYLIESCDDGEKVLKLLRKFDPDVLVLDLRLPKVDALTVLRSLRSAGYTTKVIVLASFMSEYINRELSLLGVSTVLMIPTTLGSLVNSIRDITSENQDNEQSIEAAAERILLDLGFNMGRACYSVVYSALLYVSNNPNCFMTKCLYPDLAKVYGGTKEKIEKSIRDGIKGAWKNGAREVWYLYFPNLSVVSESDSKRRWPTNEAFLNRIASALCQKERVKKPYATKESIAQ